MSVIITPARRFLREALLGSKRYGCKYERVEISESKDCGRKMWMWASADAIKCSSLVLRDSEGGSWFVADGLDAAAAVADADADIRREVIHCLMTCTRRRTSNRPLVSITTMVAFWP